MKKLSVLCALFLLAGLIVLPASTSGKYDVSKPAVADGSPLPWPPPPPNPVLVADGSPLPWPPPPPNSANVG